MNEDILKNILKELKSRLDITWDSDITDTKLLNVIKNSIPKLNRLIGATITDYLKEGLEEELELLLNYCMYSWENKTEFFKTNYLDDIMSLQQKYEVENYRSQLKVEATNDEQ